MQLAAFFLCKGTSKGWNIETYTTLSSTDIGNSEVMEKQKSIDLLMAH